MAVRSIVSVVAAALAVALLLAAPAAAQSLASQQSELRILNCDLNSKSLDDCDIMAYGYRVGVFSAPGLVVAALLVLAFPLYCGGKYCCNCCGGRRQSPNFCFPNEDMAARYSKGDLVRPKLFTVIALVVSLGALGWGVTGGSGLQAAIIDMTDQIENVPTLLRERIELINDALVITLFNASTDANETYRLMTIPGTFGYDAYVAANDTLNTLDGMIGDNIGVVRDYVNQYAVVVFVVFCVPCGIIFVGCIIAFCNLRRYVSMGAVWLSFLVAVIIWIVHAAFCMTSMVVGDGCVEVHGVAYQQQNVLPVLLGCNDSMFTDLRSSFADLKASQAQSVCDGIAPFCYDEGQTATANAAARQVFVCPSPMNCSSVTVGQLSVWADTAFYIHPNINSDGAAAAAGYRCATVANQARCYLRLCEHDCTNGTGVSEVGLIARQGWYGVLAAEQVSSAIDTLGSEYSSCDSILRVIVSPFDPPCEDTVTALVYNRQASGVLGLAMLGAIFAFAWGAKRYMPLDQADKPQTDDRDKEMDEIDA